MPQIYGTKHEKLQPCVIDRRSLEAIGRLIRAFAEIEHIIGLYVGAHCGLNSSQLVVLLGKSPISKKLEMAGYLAKKAGPDFEGPFKIVFNPDFTELLGCRNAVAHGVLLGIDSEGLYNFLTDKTDLPADGSAIQLVPGYHPAFLKNAAERAEKLVDFAQDELGMRSSREICLEQPLRPHRKAQPRRGDK